MSASHKFDRLAVHLPDTTGTMVRVGTLTREPSGMVTFEVAEGYIDMGPNRPVLSTCWLRQGDENMTVQRLRSPEGKRATNNNLPPWFAGLLPEGALRLLVETDLGTGRHGDFDVIKHVGRDLPGAVVVVPEGEAPLPWAPEAVDAAGKVHVRFSLAGVQPKWSMAEGQGRLTLPAFGTDGHIIAKMANEEIGDMPECEYATMLMARAVGIETADVMLYPKSAVEGLPPEMLRYGDSVLAIKRFDRQAGSRQHMEDYAQVFGATGDQKYIFANTETCIKLSGMFAEDHFGTILEATRRVVANILLGNNDCHLKNWSLLLQPGGRPRLSPAYDITPTVAFDNGRKMALKFSGAQAVDAVRMRNFTHPASFFRVPAAAIEAEVRRTVREAAERWSSMRQGLPMSLDRQRSLARLWQALPLTEGVGCPFPDAPPRPAGSVAKRAQEIREAMAPAAAHAPEPTADGAEVPAP